MAYHQLEFERKLLKFINRSFIFLQSIFKSFLDDNFITKETLIMGRVFHLRSKFKL